MRALTRLARPSMLMAPMHAGLGRLHRVVLVMDGRGRAGEVVDFVDLDIEREGHVVAHQLEARVVEQMRDVALGAGEEVVDADDVVAAFEQPVAQMRAEKAGAAGDHDGAVIDVLVHWLNMPIDCFAGLQRYHLLRSTPENCLILMAGFVHGAG